MVAGLPRGGHLRAAWLLPLTVVLATAAPSPSAEPAAAPELLVGRAYEERLIERIDAARTSIEVLMYLVNLPPENRPTQAVPGLVARLAAARARGVAIRVVLDTAQPERDAEAAAEPSPNLAAARALAAAGIAVRWDEPTRTTHAKALVIDGRWCFVGSANWTGGGLRANRDATVLLESADLARQFAAEFERAWRAGTAEPIPARP